MVGSSTAAETFTHSLVAVLIASKRHTVSSCKT